MKKFHRNDKFDLRRRRQEEKGYRAVTIFITEELQKRPSFMSEDPNRGDYTEGRITLERGIPVVNLDASGRFRGQGSKERI